MKLPKIFKGKVDSPNKEGGDFPHHTGKEELCWKLKPHEYSNTALLPSFYRKFANA